MQRFKCGIVIIILISFWACSRKAINESYFKCFLCAFCMDENMQTQCTPKENSSECRHRARLSILWHVHSKNPQCIRTAYSLQMNICCMYSLFRFNLVKIMLHSLTKCFEHVSNVPVFNRTLFIFYIESEMQSKRERENKREREKKRKCIFPDDFESHMVQPQQCWCNLKSRKFTQVNCSLLAERVLLRPIILSKKMENRNTSIFDLMPRELTLEGQPSWISLLAAFCVCATCSFM